MLKSTERSANQTRASGLWRLALLGGLLCVPPGINLLQYWLSNPLYGYGLWVPPLCLYLFWLRREIPALRPSGSALPVIVIGAYLFTIPWVRIVQVANPDWRLLDFILSVGAVLSLLALFFKVGGKPLLREFWLPSCFLLTAVPWSTAAEQAFIGWAIPFTGRIASEVLWTLGVAAVDVGRTLHTSIGPIQVSEDCSGIRSFHLALAVGVFWACYFRLNKGRGIAMGIATLAVTLLVNILRMTAIVFFSVRANQLSLVHAWDGPMGSVAQVLLLLIIPGLGWMLSRSEPAGEASVGKTNAPGTLLPVPAGVLVACLSWLLATELGVEGWFRLHENPRSASAGYWGLNTRPEGVNVSETEIPENVKQNYFYSQGHRLVWKDAEQAPWSLLYLDFNQGNLSACTHNIHRPEVCLPMADFNLLSQFEPLRVVSADGELQFAHQLFQRGNLSIHLFHAYLQESQDGGNQSDWSYRGRFRAALRGIRSHRAELVHLIVERAYSKEEARSAAAGYLGKLLERRTGR